ncbi:MAG: hypothetical protein HY289_15680 [Planctomycetes bacterium]|nr:hypothetical protein [Planctomycetota bacterium]
MMTIEFGDRGLLPVGVHDASLQEVEASMGRFQTSDRRIVLFSKLKRYIEEIRKAGWAATLVLDGSFVMGAVDEPEDIDAILILPADWDQAQDLRPLEYNLVSRNRAQKEFEIEVKVVRSGSDEESKWLAFFAKVNIKWCQAFGWPIDSKKGLVRINP